MKKHFSQVESLWRVSVSVVVFPPEARFSGRRNRGGGNVRKVSIPNSKRILFCPCEVVLKGLAKLILLDIGDIAIDVKGELSKEELKRYILSTKDL